MYLTLYNGMIVINPLEKLKNIFKIRIQNLDDERLLDNISCMRQS